MLIRAPLGYSVKVTRLAPRLGFERHAINVRLRNAPRHDRPVSTLSSVDFPFSSTAVPHSGNLVKAPVVRWKHYNTIALATDQKRQSQAHAIHVHIQPWLRRKRQIIYKDTPARRLAQHGYHQSSRHHLQLWP